MVLGRGHKKRGAELPLVPRYKGSRIALLVETSNAESPTSMFIIALLLLLCERQGGQGINIPWSVPVALLLTNNFEFARFLYRQNQSVQ